MKATWRAEGSYYTFENDVVAGKYLTEGHYQGMRSLVHRPTGVEIAAGETLPGLAAPYRVFGNGRRYDDVRERAPRVEIVPEGVRMTHAADAANPFELVSVYAWEGDTLDIHYTVRADVELRAFEIGIASYLAAGYRAFIWRQSNVWGEAASRIVPVDVNPMTDVYALFPRSEAEMKTIFDGRWDLPPYPVRHPVPAFYAEPLAYRRHDATGVTAVAMADRQECYAVGIPVNDPPENPDPARGYQALYFYYFGRDLRAGEEAATRLRWVIGRDMSEADIRARWQAFAAG